MASSIAYKVQEVCVFPVDFTDADKEKFALEVASEAGRYLPEGDIDSLVEEITGTARTVTVKYGKTVHKAGKGEKINYTFRLSVALAVFAMLKLSKTTGYSLSVDLTGHDTFWSTWKRAETVKEASASN